MRDPAKYQKLLNQQPTATIDNVHNATNWAEAIILAYPGAYEAADMQASAATLGPGADGKVVIDVGNPVSAYPALETRVWKHPASSGGEVVSAALPKSYVFKAFNTIGVEHMGHGDGSQVTGEQLSMLFCGPEDKKEVVEEIITGVGFIPEYVGGIRYARNLEAIAELWIHLGVPGVGETKEDWGRAFHFQVLKKK